MKKSIFIVSVFILVISIFIIIMQTDRAVNSTVTVMQKAFDTTGAKVTISEIYMREKLYDESFSDAEKRIRLLSDVITGIGGNTAEVRPVFLSIDNDSSTGTETNYIINDNSSIKISILKDRHRGRPFEYQLSISLTDTSQQQKIAESARGLSNTMKRYGIKPNVNICITGSLEGRLKDSDLETLCSRIFDSAGASTVEGMRDKGLISISAFSPSINGAVRVKGKRVNLNVAVRFNSYEDKTYIWLATPVITMEY